MGCRTADDDVERLFVKKLIEKLANGVRKFFVLVGTIIRNGFKPTILYLRSLLMKFAKGRVLLI